MTAPQLGQKALRGLISNSLPSTMQEGSPAWLIRDCPHAGGTIGGQPQALQVLRTRYQVERVVRAPADVLTDLLSPQWPRKLSAQLYLAMVRGKEQLAVEAGLSPDGGDAADVKHRQQWVVASHC